MISYYESIDPFTKNEVFDYILGLESLMTHINLDDSFLLV